MVRPLRSAPLVLTLLATGAATAISPGTPARAAPGQTAVNAQNLCTPAVSRQEKRHGIPRHLLTAISLVESGRWDSGRGTTAAWPWTVTAQGKGRFFPTKAAAIAEVRRLQARGITSIDVGCMQVNLHFHPDAFSNLNAAFDPTRNADYAANFLTTLKRDHGSWRAAVQHYHSSTAEKRIPYQKKVYAAWRDAAPAHATQQADASRIRRISRQIERDHRRKISDYRRTQRAAKAAISKAGDAEPDTPRFLAAWPPRNAQAQLRAQNLARAWAFGGTARSVRP
jgi:hypothetical protein